jgi:hypothetical protein
MYSHLPSITGGRSSNRNLNTRHAVDIYMICNFFILLFFIFSLFLYFSRLHYFLHALSLCFFQLSFTLCFLHFTLFDRQRTNQGPETRQRLVNNLELKTSDYRVEALFWWYMSRQRGAREVASRFRLGFVQQINCRFCADEPKTIYYSISLLNGSLFVTSARGKWHNQIGNCLVSKSITSRQNLVVKNHLLFEN